MNLIAWIFLILFFAASGVGLLMALKAQKATAEASLAQAKAESDIKAERERLLEEAQREAQRLRQRGEQEAETIRKESELKAKEQALQARTEAEKLLTERQKNLEKQEQRLQSKEEGLDKKHQQVDQKTKDVETLSEKRKAELERLEAQQVEARQLVEAQAKRLEEVAGLTREDAKKELISQLEYSAKMDAAKLVRRIEEEAQEEAAKKARWTIGAAIQRVASDVVAEQAVSSVQLPSDDLKGRIIGREGRNIKSFESATGVTLLIDESPQMVLVSSFDPVRREIARTALDALVKDGRIHPASIEEFVRRAQDEIDLVTTQAGEDAVTKLNINGLHPEIIKLLGRLKYRFSYNQNVLDHSVETAFLASLIASEVGLDPNVAKRAGLLHDIGKGVPGELEGSHAVIGAEFIKRYGETPIVVNAVAAHHEEVKPETVYAGLVILADTISATRPGARAESMTGYIQRLGRLEKLAMSLDGVQQAFAIQAGREIRVVVSPQEVTDERAREIAKELRARIEAELQYPSTIKITVIRESRFTETAT